MSRFLTDRRSVTSLEYALLAGALALVLVSVLRVPVIDLMQALQHVLVAMRGHVPSL
jgi:Flp pilus assembly pilin Flp